MLMAVTDPRSSDQRPLSLDLALSRLSLALLKARSGNPLEQSHVEDARLLSELLARQLRERSQTDEVSEEVVPSDTLRSGLEDTLATLPQSSNDVETLDDEQIEECVRLLNKIANEHELTGAEINQLLELLYSLSGGDEEPERLESLRKTLPGSDVR